MIKARIPLALVAATSLLAACDGSSGAGVSRDINSLGAAFVAAFNKARNSEPVDAQSVNLVLTPTLEPFNP